MKNTKTAPSFNNWEDFENEVNRFFDGLFTTPRHRAHCRPTQGTWRPSVDVHEDEETYLIHMDLPGMDKDDINVNLEGRRLTISGERVVDPEAETANRYRTERFQGKFSRTFSFSKEIASSKIEALYKDGVLTLTIPKSKASKAKNIKIS